MAPAQRQGRQCNVVTTSTTTVPTPAQRKQERQRSAGKDASSVRTMCCEQHCQWAEASGTRAMTPAQQRQRRQRMEGKDASAMLMVTPGPRVPCSAGPEDGTRKARRDACASLNGPSDDIRVGLYHWNPATPGYLCGHPTAKLTRGVGENTAVPATNSGR
jgi:hypothetical protein